MNNSLETFYDDLSKQDNAIYSEQAHQQDYQNCLTQISNDFGFLNADIQIDLDKLFPYLALADRLESCNASEAMILYTEISKGYQVAAYLCGKANFNLNQWASELKTIRGKHYLEEFPHYVSRMKANDTVIKDTDASREHYLNTAEEVTKAKHKLDFYTSYSTTLDGMKTKLFSDMSHARSICYQKRYMDQLPTSAS